MSSIVPLLAIAHDLRPRPIRSVMFGINSRLKIPALIRDQAAGINRWTTQIGFDELTWQKYFGNLIQAHNPKQGQHHPVLAALTNRLPAHIRDHDIPTALKNLDATIPDQSDMYWVSESTIQRLGPLFKVMENHPGLKADGQLQDLAQSIGPVLSRTQLIGAQIGIGLLALAVLAVAIFREKPNHDIAPAPTPKQIIPSPSSPELTPAPIPDKETEDKKPAIPKLPNPSRLAQNSTFAPHAAFKLQYMRAL